MKNHYKYYFIGGGMDGVIATLSHKASKDLIVDEMGHIAPLDSEHRDWPFYTLDEKFKHAECDGVFIHIRNTAMLSHITHLNKVG